MTVLFASCFELGVLFRYTCSKICRGSVAVLVANINTEFYMISCKLFRVLYLCVCVCQYSHHLCFTVALDNVTGAHLERTK